VIIVELRLLTIPLAFIGILKTINFVVKIVQILFGKMKDWRDKDTGMSRSKRKKHIKNILKNLEKQNSELIYFSMENKTIKSEKNGTLDILLVRIEKKTA